MKFKPVVASCARSGGAQNTIWNRTLTILSFEHRPFASYHPFTSLKKPAKRVIVLLFLSLQNMKEANTIFEQITTVEKGNNLAKSKRLESVSVTSKALFVGNAANWKYKWKDVTKLEVDGACLYFETQNKSVELVNAEEETWLNFSQIVLKRWDKLQGKSNVQEETVAQVVSMVKKPRYRSKRVFGTQARRHHRLLASAEANRRIEWSDEEEEEKENHAPSVQEEADYQSMEIAPHSDDDAIFATSEDEKSIVPRSVKKDRIRRKVVDEDSDEELFDDVPMTIQSVSGGRLVTPHNKSVIQDDEDEELFTSTPPPDTASPLREKGQLPVSSFFTKFEAKKSDTKASKAAVTTPKIRVKPSSPTEVLTPIQQDNAAWIENTQPSTPTRTPKRVAPPTPAKTPARSPALRDISRHFRPPKRTHDHQDDDIEEFSEDEVTSTHKRLRITTSARKRFVNTRPGQYRQGIADSVIALASSERRQNPQQLPAPNSSGKSLPPVSHWKGLRNLGNTCYLNSSLQLIYTIRDFCSGLVGHGGDLSRSIMEVAKLMEETTSQSVSPRRVKEAVDHLTDRFCGNEQRDAHEFISDIIDRVHDELEEEQKEHKEDTLPKVSAPLLTDAFFRMNVRVCLKCDSCGYERYVVCVILLRID